LNNRSDDIITLSKRIDRLTEAIDLLTVKVGALSQLCQQFADHRFYEGDIQAESLHMSPPATAFPSDLPSNQPPVRPSTTTRGTKTPDKQPPQSVATA
jgi:hypothetical protein